jgi:Ca2+-transporting ATPase
MSAVPAVDEYRGLTNADAAARLARDGRNELPASAVPGLAARLSRHLVEPLALLLLGAAGIAGIVLGEVVEAVAIAAIVVLNAALGTVQESRADAAVRALARLASPTATVRRDSVVQDIDACDVVVGDVVLLTAGDRVPADLALVEAANLAVDESLLTGESIPVEKLVATGPRNAPTLLAERTGEAFAGTLVVRGAATAVVVATGGRTATGAIASSLAETTDPPLVRELASVGRRLTVLAILLGAVVAGVVLARPDSGVGDAALSGVALAVAAIPEALPTVVVTSLALGARRMASHGAIVRRLPAIEALGSTTVVCTDKTGTLTTGRLSITQVAALPGRETALWDAALRTSTGTTDPLDVAVVEAASAAGRQWSVEQVMVDLPFDSETRTASRVVATDDGPVLAVKGAPEVVLARCPPGEDVDHLRRVVDEATSRGGRVIAVASGRTGDTESGDLVPLGLLVFEDPLRASTRAAVDTCRRAGIRLVLVTGDHPVTAAAVAAAAGLDARCVVTGASVAAAASSNRAGMLRDADVVARVDPATKVELVDAHRAAGEVVAMVGDGVNDAPALRRADVGVAMAGSNGTDVAREAADIVVVDEDLDTIVEAVVAGRTIDRNLSHVVGYLLAGNLSEVAVVVGTALLLPELGVPLLPVQLLWLNLVTDGLPAGALGVDRPANPSSLLAAHRGRGERLLTGRRTMALVVRAATLAAPVLLAGWLAHRSGWDAAVVRSELLLALVCSHLVLAYSTRAGRWAFERGWWRSGPVAAAVGGSLVLQVPVFALPPVRSALELGALPPSGWVLAAAAALVSVAGTEIARRLLPERSSRAQAAG